MNIHGIVVCFLVFQSLAAALSLRFVLYWRTTPCQQIEESLDTLTYPTKKGHFVFK